MMGLTTKNKRVINGGTLVRRHSYSYNIIINGNPYSKSRQKPMTICIAAIAKDGEEECIVLATDHMVSLGEDNQFEHDIKKYKKINKTTVALLSGQFLMFDDLISLSSSNLSYSEIINEIFENFKRIRTMKIESEILDRAQIEKDFLLNRLMEPEINPVIGAICKEIYNYTLETTIVLVGFEGNKARITEIDEEGIEQCRDMYFTTIGIGFEAAHNTLLYQKHNMADPIIKTIYNVFKAKTQTEHLSGIGKETEILILKKDGLYEVSKLKPLEEIYNEEINVGKNHQRLSEILIERVEDKND